MQTTPEVWERIERRAEGFVYRMPCYAVHGLDTVPPVVELLVEAAPYDQGPVAEQKENPDDLTSENN